MSRYIYENGIRIVKPYYLTYKTNVKLRWIGKTLIDILTIEFNESKKAIINDITTEKLYIENKKSITKGELLINCKIESHDVINHLNHKHEAPIPDKEIEIVYQDDDLIVVNKPSGIPTHPTGNYKYNTVSEMVKEKIGLDNIWVVHRLDKVTSGVLILAKNKTAGSKFSKILKEQRDECKKVYLARVKGRFLDDEIIFQAPVILVNMNGYIPGDEIQTNSKTIFKKVKYDEVEDESIVECTPITGKNHQIRMHLKVLGYPITNDFFYNPTDKNTVEKCKIEEKLYKNYFGKYGNELPDVISVSDIKDDTIEHDLSKLKESKANSIVNKRTEFCYECQRNIFPNVLEDYQIYLHALEFHYKDYHFKTDLPDWYN
ncbi:unnamed protein product [Candida verbasci]|uniref:Pseudouridine synthase RsuA/RluA-like domain-containing protein n=1 Tax=Candida verbasci TaxID=1227364 RepID=A0A9W4XBZ0_9ASCO|nr:unnamed protein product [Candida verbasci]